MAGEKARPHTTVYKRFFETYEGRSDLSSNGPESLMLKLLSSLKSMQLLTGRCLCEGVAYEIRGELGPIFNCHCSKCRRWHGAAFRTRATINANQFTWLKGRELVAGYHSSEFVVKHFCKVCGSNLISTYENDPYKIGVPLGGLDQSPNNKPEGHFWVGSKSPWYAITDGLPQYETWPGSHEKVRETRGDT